MLHKQIKDEIKQAMIAKDSAKLLVLRGVLSNFMNEMMAKKIVGEELPDEDALAVVRRLVKQRKDSIEQFTKGGRPELASSEEAEMKILEAYLPQMMSKDEVIKYVNDKKLLANFDKSKMGQAVGAVMKELKGKADGMVVKAVVEELLA